MQVLPFDFNETLHTFRAIKNNRNFFLYRRRRNFKGGN